MFAKLWPRLPRGGPEVEIGVAVPIGCLVPAGMLLAIAIGVGVLAGTHLQRSPPAQSVVVRVIDDGAPGGPAVLSTAIVPLR